MPDKYLPLKYSISGKDIEVNCPIPIISNIDVVPYKKRMSTQEAINALIDGHHVLVLDYYSSGLSVLNDLKTYIKRSYSDESFQGQREFRSVFHELSNKLLLKVSNHKIVARKAPDIGWLQILYPKLKEYLLPFPQIQGLNSSWQWYQKGIHIPTLGKKIYPWYGTYMPTRFEHLELFDKWLKSYRGNKETAIDIGIGSGVLTYQLLKKGFQKVHGTDINPNAIIGLNESMPNKLQSKIKLEYGDLFAEMDIKSELIVFNPPWIPSTYDSNGIDNAIYYNNTLFTRFFSEATKYLKKGGRIVLLFSNIAQLTKVSKNNPIEVEIATGGRYKKEVYMQKEVKAASKKTKRNQNWRSNELVELWVLKLIDDL